MKLDLYSKNKKKKYNGIHKNWLDENRNKLVPKLLKSIIIY